MTPHGPDLSLTALILAADPVVKSVMALLVLASIACWGVMIEKFITLGRLAREARAIKEIEQPQGDGLAAEVLRAGGTEWREGRDDEESGGEFRDRIERAMRSVFAARMRLAEHGLPILATTGSVAPFVGLFGTVWGIMNSFSGIAQRQDTSLATVAPGIAEALFATAIGLAAAIPAVMAYNRCAIRLGRIRAEGFSAIGTIAQRLARRPRVARPAAVRGAAAE
ncbi:MotA/TolQ/ExbB proton channel family protein [Plastoroseomonas hellenica]|uniref:Flagellar motor protein MotA n=1 Tax=Plastoroseomonas hellenica TaxID=2687306 RepID=A0ABS5EYA8_9PROT|nr:MotA/TolQ/ExbB proton channel family protein [Plastoroseomonas hellenica]MBR0642998.1 flagellar motor protein MotA [Plastoroseomonas hellenica]MBR0665266.1 flagellar motor protein MotA [Plastoroseomonas hellenica]